MLLRYVQALIAQTAQTALCNRHHSIEQQFCRRLLLLGLDRSPSHELMLTHERAANLLSVRREGVTAAAQKLQRSGVIRYNRGRIAVLDRKRLEQAVASVMRRPRENTTACCLPWQPPSVRAHSPPLHAVR